jgi:RecB family exonuclease/inactivated superfamily I helicase
VRVSDLHAFRQAIVSCSVQGDPGVVRSTAVVVPTRGAASYLQRLFLAAAPGRSDIPAILTRDELYLFLNARLAEPLGILTGSEREVLLQTSAMHAAANGAEPPFRLRPGLVGEMMRFYDQLRRQGQSVDRYESLLVESLDTDSDRGAERLLRQTRFLAASYRVYERGVAALPAVDEHALRAHLIQHAAARPLTRVVIAVGDWIADPHGLFAADFDLLTRVAGLAEIDVVATRGLLGSGFDQRINDWLPGLETIEDGDPGVVASPAPRMLVPDREDGIPVWISRDREEELVAVARRAAIEPDGHAVVFAKPLPYLYLAREVFGSARIPYQAVDTLPLAAEPAAAALDLIIEFASSEFTRASALALLRSPQLVLGAGLTRQGLAGLDRVMHAQRYLGEIDALRAFVAGFSGDGEVRQAAAVVARVAEELLPLTHAAPASAQLAALAMFLESHAAPDAGDRSVRACAAIVGVLKSLASAHASYGGAGADVATIEDLAPDIRRWIEEQTFDPRGGAEGVHLLDAHAARFGEFDSITIVGMIEGEWPDRPRRNIFYSPATLATLGWPSERDRWSASTAAFIDLLRSSSRHVVVSTFRFDDEALVEPSFLIEELEAARLTTARDEAVESSAVFRDEALWADPVQLDALDTAAREWAVFRQARSSGTLPAYHGAAGPQAPRTLSVSAIETYETCPFKYFARYVMRLDEEREDEEVMDPKRQGLFVHKVFEVFFTAWQRRGHRAITVANLDAARELFGSVAEEQLKALPEAEAALERTRLLGSPVAAGLGEVVFRMEAERPVEVVERLIEYKLKGGFGFAGPHGTRTIALTGVADRLDLLEDGTFRLIDYKLSSAPNKSRALQLPIYGICAEQRLQHHRGRDWTLGEAAYISFRGARKVTPLFTARSDRATVLASARGRLIDAVDAIERGEFPPTPEDVFLCGFCSYGAVCRKDYVGDI